MIDSVPSIQSLDMDGNVTGRRDKCCQTPCPVKYELYAYVGTRASSFEGATNLPLFRRMLVRNATAMESVAMLRTRAVKPHHIHLVSDPTIEMLNMPCKRNVNETK